MFWPLFQILGPLIGGLALAITWWLWGRQVRLAGYGNRVIALLAGLLLVFGITAERLLSESWLMPFDASLASVDMDLYVGSRFIIPLLLGILGLILLAFPVRSRSGEGAASLSPRTPVSFGRRSWFLIPAVILMVIVVLTLIAGSAAEADPATGRYTMYFVDIGAEYGMGSNIYGWFYSVPSMILLVILVALAVLDLSRISRPALSIDHDKDVQVRTARTRNISAVTTGALLVHLGAILDSLARTASVRSQFAIEGGILSSWSPFAALEPVLFILGGVAVALGVALWATVVLSVFSTRSRTKGLEVSA